MVNYKNHVIIKSRKDSLEHVMKFSAEVLSFVYIVTVYFCSKQGLVEKAIYVHHVTGPSNNFILKCKEKLANINCKKLI